MNQASTTVFSVSGNTYLGSITGPLQAINGLVSATSTMSLAYGGTGLSTAPIYGQLLIGNALGGYTLTSTSSLGLASWSTTSANYWETTQVARGGGGFSTTSNNYWLSQNQGNAFSTTSGNYLLSTFNKGYFFSTSSADYWLTLNRSNAFSSTSASYWLAQNLNNAFSSSSADYWKSFNNFFSTTSADNWLTLNQGKAFSTTSANYWRSVSDLWSTTSAIYFAHSSTTIPKTYTSNTFTGENIFTSSTTLQNFTAQNGTTTNLTVSTDATIGRKLSIGNPAIPGLTVYEKVFINDETGAQSDVSFKVAGGGWPVWNFGSAKGTLTSPSINDADADVGQMSFYGYDGTSFMESSNYKGQIDGTPGVGSMPGRIVFNTTRAGSVTPSFSMVINSKGFVGIGTTTPYAALSVVGQVVGSYFTATSTTATSTFANGINITGGCFSVNGVCISLNGNGSNSWSTTSANYWLTLNRENSFSTTSANHFLVQNQGNAFSSTSANYFANSSTTLAKTYTSNTFTAPQTFNYASATAFTVLGNAYLGSITGPLQAINGLVSATSAMSIAYGGTGLSTAPTYGQLLIGNSLGGYTLTSTSSLGLASWSTTSANYWETTQAARGGGSFATTTVDYWKTQRDFFSTTSANYFVNSSTTIPKTYTSNTFTAPQLFNYASATAFTVTGSTYMGSITGPLQAINGLISASSTMSVAYGGTGLSTAPTYGQVLLGNSNGGYSLVATSSLGLTSPWTTSGLNIFSNNAGNVGIGTSSPFAKLSVVGDVVASNLIATSTDGNVMIGNNAFPNRVASTDAGGISLSGWSGVTSNLGLFSEVDGQLLSYGINATQIGNRDTSRIGAMCRMHTRANTPYFSIKKQVGTIETSNFQIATSGAIAIGSNFPSDFNAPLAQLHVRNSDPSQPALLLDSTFSGQTANMFAIFNSLGATTTSFDANGNGTTTGSFRISGTASTSNFIVSNTIEGAGLSDCHATSSKLMWNATTKKFECGVDHGAPLAKGNSAMATSTLNATNRVILSTSIAPSSSSVQVRIDATAQINSGSNTDDDVNVTLIRGYACGVNVLATRIHFTTLTAATGIGEGLVSFAITDSPATNASTTYSICAKSAAGIAHNITNRDILVQEIDTIGAADLAEIYPTNDNSIESGDIVSLDPDMDIGVKKSEKSTKELILGVASTKPALLIGGMEGEGISGIPVALSGRVPVKVSTENGNIKKGDNLTMSSIAGVAMKARKSGNIIGKAISGYSDDGIGRVNMFVGNENYNGDGLGEMASSTSLVDNGFSRNVLAKLISDKELLIQNRATTSLSEIFTDRIAAGLEIIAPKATIGGLTVDKIGSVGNIVEMLNDVNFFGRAYFNADMGGFALIPQGQKSVDIVFDKEYVNQPVVNSTISFNDGEDNGKDALVWASDIKYLITKKSTKGFTIALNINAPIDIRLSWMALAIKDAKTFSPRGQGASIQQNDTASVSQAITEGSSSRNANSTTGVLPSVANEATSSSQLPIDNSTSSISTGTTTESAPVNETPITPEVTNPVVESMEPVTEPVVEPIVAPVVELNNISNTPSVSEVVSETVAAPVEAVTSN
ncbi:MAG: hypothetical protein WCO84_04405 [bacterium]